MTLPGGRYAEQREERRGEGTVHYRMRQRLMSIGDDFWIETDSGQRAYQVDGKALRLRKTLICEDADGRELVKIQAGGPGQGLDGDRGRPRPPDGDRDEGPGQPAAGPLDRQDWRRSGPGHPEQHPGPRVHLHRRRTPVAPCPRSGFRGADTYCVEIAPYQDPVVLLAATV